MSEQVADLYADLGLHVNTSQWNRGTAAITGLQQQLGALEGAFQDKQGRWRAASGRFLTMQEKAAAGLGGALGNTGKKAKEAELNISKLAAVASAVFFAPRLYDGLIGFNSRMEDAHTTIAGLFAMVKKTDLAEQLKPADDMLAHLQERAKTLPGTTADYVKTLSLITQPLLAAGASMQELEDITVNTVVASKALRIDTEVGARDVSQAARGQYHSVDQLTGAVLGVDGFDGEEGRSRFNAMDKHARVKQLSKSFNTPQLAQMGEAQGKTFSGTLSTLTDNISILAGKIGLPVFQHLTAMFKEWNAWLDANKDRVKEFASAVGEKLVTALEALVVVGGIVIDVLKFFAEHSELTKGIIIGLGIVITAFAIQAAIDWAIAFWPITLAVLAIAALYLVIQDLWEAITEGTGVTAAVLGWFSDLTDIIGKGISDAIHEIRNAIRSVTDWFVSIFEYVWNIHKKVGTWFDELGDKIKDAFQRAYDYVVSLDWAKAIPVLGPLGEFIGHAAGAVVTGQGYGLPDVDKVITGGPPTRNMSTPAGASNTNVTVEVKGNIPSDWIDATVTAAVQDHHDTTWNNAANALGVEND